MQWLLDLKKIVMTTFGFKEKLKISMLRYMRQILKQ
jgi:hypothetical protein